VFEFGRSFFDSHCGRGISGRRLAAGDALANLEGDGVVDRAGVRFLLGDAELGQHFEKSMGGNLELPGQLVNSDFAHSYCNTLESGRLTDLLRVLYSIRFTFLFC